ncbi:MAG: 3-deoxy-D-manno-octulosonate 8-phosphate phosphatase [Bacteroidota bacterium]
MNNLEIFSQIHTFIFDVDGVLTNSQVLVMQDGQLLRQMSIRDGYAIKRAVEEGYRVVIISGGKSEGVRIRLQNLGVPDVYLGIQDKLDTYEEVVDMYDLEEGGILYMGDDLPDYPVMRRVGLPTCPANAAHEIKAISQYISSFEGGAGCARDVIEKVLRLRGDWEPEDE